MQTQLEDLFNGSEDRPILVHSCMLGAASMIHDMRQRRSEILNQHLKILETVAAGRDLIFPMFNYDYPTTRKFHVNRDPSHVGPLSEYVRKNHLQWRTPTPMYSFGGVADSSFGLVDKIGSDTHGEMKVFSPFSEKSLFHELVEANGYILFYGADISANTFGHYAEYRSGLNYRYQKSFPGVVEYDSGLQEKSLLVIHVRPMGANLKYGNPDGMKDLEENGLVKYAYCQDEIVAQLFEAKNLLEFYLYKLGSDPLYMLSPESRQWVEPMLDKLGRPFEISDFEEVADDV